MLPAQRRSQIQVLLRELAAAGQVHVRGTTRATRWYPGSALPIATARRLSCNDRAIRRHRSRVSNNCESGAIAARSSLVAIRSPPRDAAGCLALGLAEGDPSARARNSLMARFLKPHPRSQVATSAVLVPDRERNAPH